MGEASGTTNQTFPAVPEASPTANRALLGVGIASPAPGGNLGAFNDARVLGLARLSQDDDLDIEKPEWEYAADLKAAIAAQLAIFDAKAEDRTGGERMAATRSRNKALELFGLSLSRARFLICGASDDLDQSPELRRAGFKVRKVREAKKPAVPPVQ